MLDKLKMGIILEYINLNPNYFELGGLIRSNMSDLDLVKKYPNDFDLGRAIRRLSDNQ